MEISCEGCIYFDLFLQECVFYENNPDELERPCDEYDEDCQTYEDQMIDLKGMY